MLDLTTINARDAGRLVTTAIETAQMSQAGQTQANTYQTLAQQADYLRGLLRLVRSELRAIRDTWNADDLSAELDNNTFSFDYMSREQVVELLAGALALETFFTTEVTVTPGVSITPDRMISRTKPPAPGWGILPPPAQQETNTEQPPNQEDPEQPNLPAA